MDLSFLGDHSTLGQFWNKQPKLFRSAISDCNDLPTSESVMISLSGHIKSGEFLPPDDVQINVSRVNIDKSIQQELGVSSSRAKAMYAQGYGICLGDLSRNHPELSALKTKASDLFGQPELISITGYLTPPYSTGVLHFDRQHNIFLQSEGRKKWHFSKIPAVRNPVDNFVLAPGSQKAIEHLSARGYHILMPSECGRQELVLEQGDALYLPPGFYHNPETDASHSFHFTLTIEPDCFWNSFSPGFSEILLRNHENFFADMRMLSEAEKAQHRRLCQNTFIDAL